MKNKTISFFTVLLCCFISSTVVAQTLTIGPGAEINVVGDNSATPTYTTTIDCDGNILIQGILDLDENATLKVAGDFIKDGSTSTFTSDNSTVIMDGTIASEISGGTTPNQTSYSFYNLTIDNAAGVTINTSNLGTIRVRNILTPQTGVFTTNDVLILDALSVTNYARVAYGTGSISGLTRIEKRIEGAIPSTGFKQMSLPIAGPIVQTDWDQIKFLLDGHTPTNQINTFVYDATPSGTGDYAKGWRYAKTTDDESNAFNVYLNGTLGSIHEVKQEFNCIGNLNSGDYNYNLEFTRDPADLANLPEAKGWNFIPNPWAALVDLNALIGTPSVPTAYFTSAYKAVHVWNAYTNTYQAILASGVTKTDYHTPDPTLNSSSTNIAPFQGFWVKATAAGQVCNLVASAVQTTDQADNIAFMKTNFETMRFNVFDTDSLWDQLVIYFNEDATRDFDFVGDGYYLQSQNEDVPVFYGEEGASRASIIARQVNVTDSVQVGFSSAKDQSNFYINANLAEIPNDMYVYLKDKVTNKTVQLEHGQNLSFTNKSSNTENRFVIYFSKNENAFKHLVTSQESELIAFINNGSIVLQSHGISGPASIQVFDAVGRVLYKQDKQISLGEEITIDMNPTGQLILVKVVVNGEVIVEKLYY